MKKSVTEKASQFFKYSNLNKPQAWAKLRLVNGMPSHMAAFQKTAEQNPREFDVHHHSARNPARFRSHH